MNWAYGITTVPERMDSLLPSTIESLAAAGFDHPVLFVDGQPNGLDGLIDGIEVVSHPRLGQLGNWMSAIFYLFTNKKSDRYAIFEDDILACRQLRAYLERFPPSKVYWNLITREDNLRLTNRQPGWHESNQLGRGAQGLVFDRATADCLLRMERFVRGPSNGETMADAAVNATLKSLGYKELIHYPSLLQHVGLVSTLNNSYGHVSGFEGVDYDLLSIQPSEFVPRRNRFCTFERDGEVMVCIGCGKRIDVSDPSLPPEKYHARCQAESMR